VTERWTWAPYSRVKEAAEELKAIIRTRYPDARFRLARDPNQQRSWLLWTMVDVDDPEDVSNLVVDREVDMLSEEHIPLHVIVTDREECPAKRGTVPTSRTG
jgi:hypothetical protein